MKEEFESPTAFFFYHLENQKESCYDMCYRVLTYQGGVWEQCRAQNPKGKLPMIYSIVLFQGPGKWTAPQNFHDFMGVPPVFKKYVPQFSYDLIDLSTIPDEEIKGYAGLQIALFVLKYIQSPNLENIIREKIAPLFRELEKEKPGLEILEDLIYYLFSNRQDLDKKDVIEVFDKDIKELNIKEVVMTVAEKLRQEGKEIGEKKGRILTLSNLLRIKFHEEAENWIPSLAKLSPDSLQRVEEKILSEENIENLFPEEGQPV